MAKKLLPGIGPEEKEKLPEENLPEQGKEPFTDKEWLAYYRSLYREARDVKDEESKEEEWDEYLEAYQNIWKLPGVTVNQVYANAKVVVPSCRFRRPGVKLVPHTDPRLWFHAKVLERHTNLVMDLAGIGDVTGEIALDVYLKGRGFVKAGFSDEFTGDEAGGPVQKSYSDFVQQGWPWIRRVDPRDVWVVGGPRFGDVRYVFHKVRRPYQDVIEDEDYEPRVSHKTLGLKPKEGASRWEDVELVEVWDKKRKQWAVFEEEWEKWVKKPFPFELWPWDSEAWNEDGEHFWARPDVAQFWPQQLEMNTLREQVRRHAQLIMVKILAKQGALSKEGIAAFLKDEFGIFVEVAGDPHTVLMNFTPEFPEVLLRVLSRVETDIRRILGINVNMLGEYMPKSRISATETAEVSQGTDVRLSDRREEMRKLIERVTRKLHRYMILGWGGDTGRHQILIPSPTGQPTLTDWSMEDMKDVAEDVDVQVVERGKMTEEQEDQEVMLMLQYLGQDPTANPQTLQALKEAFFHPKPLGPPREGSSPETPPSQPSQGEGNMGGPEQ